jgi:hypothetical protein
VTITTPNLIEPLNFVKEKESDHDKQAQGRDDKGPQARWNFIDRIACQKTGDQEDQEVFHLDVPT